jgi:hypothetical protein
MGNVDEAIRRTLRLIAKGERPSRMLRLLLLDALLNEDRSDRPRDPNALVSDTARSVTQWVNTPTEERASALRELLQFTDAIGREPAVSLPDKIISLHGGLRKADVPHAFGGAVAVAYYGEPRMTKDIDVNVFIPSGDWQEVRDVLAPLGIEIEIGEGGPRGEEVKLGWEENFVHLFFSCDPLHDEMPGHVRSVPFMDSTIPIVAPEHLVIRKVTLDRIKDWVDVEQILVATDPLDLGEIESWLERMVGEDDPRMQKLGEVKAALSLD